jgi:hypothetical protein
MIALISAAKVNPKAAVICSLSPCFKENLVDVSMAQVVGGYLGKRRLEDFRKYSLNDVAARIHSKIFLFTGSKEREVLSQGRYANSVLKDSELTVIDNALHDFFSPDYLTSVKRRISWL